jgi:uncharacterized protein YukE
MGQEMKFTPEQIRSFNVNAITYREKLLNQSREIEKIIEFISASWKGVKAQKCIKALKESADEYKRIANEIEPLISAIKAVIEKIKDKHGDVV